jgi:uncharacterized protein YidB (DUF937 family)
MIVCCDGDHSEGLTAQGKDDFAQQGVPTMGLMDILNGMQNGPRGQREPNSGSGGMSPVTMAILGLLAYKAIKSFSGGQPATANQPAPSAPPQAGGGLGDLLNAGLGGLLGAGAGSILGGKAGGSVGDIFGGNNGGSVLSSGLGELLKQLQQNGQGEAANSWVGTGPNKTIPANDLASAIGADDIDALVSQTGMSRDDLLQSLSEHLPQLVDQLTPSGRLPTEQEAQRFI